MRNASRRLSLGSLGLRSAAMDEPTSLAGLVPALARRPLRSGRDRVGPGQPRRAHRRVELALEQRDVVLRAQHALEGTAQRPTRVEQATAERYGGRLLPGSELLEQRAHVTVQLLDRAHEDLAG